MNYSTDDERQAALNQLIQNLANNERLREEDVDSAACTLADIYLDENGRANGFRHMYSQITRLLFDPERGASANANYISPSVELLTNNLEIISRCVKVTANPGLSAPVRKLFDHVNLEASRIAFNASVNRQQDMRLQTTRRSLDKTSQKTREQIDKRVKSAEGEIREFKERSQRDYIAILGIFAAVVIFANGGIVFSASAIQAIAGQKVVYLAAIVSIVGLCVFDMLFAMFTFVYRMVRQGKGNWHILSKGTFIGVNLILFSIILVLLAACIFFDLIDMGLLFAEA